MDNIIEASGLSAGAVYSYFTGKDDIIHAALTTSMTGLAELLAPILKREDPLPPDVLAGEIVEKIAGFSKREGFDLKRIALLGWSEAQHNPRLKDTMRSFYMPFREDLSRAAAVWGRQGLIDPKADADAVAKTLLALILGYVVQAAVVGDVAPETIRQGLTALLKS